MRSLKFNMRYKKYRDHLKAGIWPMLCCVVEILTYDFSEHLPSISKSTKIGRIPYGGLNDQAMY